MNDFRGETSQLASNVDVQIGDKLKIYFDKTDSNVTYEAKVRIVLSLSLQFCLILLDFAYSYHFGGVSGLRDPNWRRQQSLFGALHGLEHPLRRMGQKSAHRREFDVDAQPEAQ